MQAEQTLSVWQVRQLVMLQGMQVWFDKVNS
jgi:hypothetical protein